MIERHPDNGHQVATDLFTGRVIDDFEPRPIRRESEGALRPSRSSHADWEILAIWGFVVFSSAAFFFAGYVIWVKCHGG